MAVLPHPGLLPWRERLREPPRPAISAPEPGRAALLRGLGLLGLAEADQLHGEGGVGGMGAHGPRPHPSRERRLLKAAWKYPADEAHSSPQHANGDSVRILYTFYDDFRH